MEQGREKVKRYYVEEFDEPIDKPEPHEDGNVVLYSDYASLLEQLEQTTERADYNAQRMVYLNQECTRLTSQLTESLARAERAEKEARVLQRTLDLIMDDAGWNSFTGLRFQRYRAEAEATSTQGAGREESES